MRSELSNPFYSAENGQKDQQIGYILRRKAPNYPAPSFDILFIASYLIKSGNISGYGICSALIDRN